VPGRMRPRPQGLFSDVELLSDDGESWPEAARLRELALALQGVFAQQERQNALCDEFLDLCSMHGESHPANASWRELFWSASNVRGGHSAQRGAPVLVAVHAFLALVAGFATMAILVVVLTAALARLVPEWLERKAILDSGMRW